VTQINTVHDNNVTMLPINVKLNPKVLCNDDILYPIDPLIGRGEHLVDISQRYLRNTMEQLVLHVTGLLTLSSYLPPHLITLIPCFVMLFVIGTLEVYN
jgi:hypothetical protein